MSAIPEIEARFDAIKLVLQELKHLEKRARRGNATHAQNRMIAATRASFYLMIYNAIEGSIRQTLSELRSSIQADNLPFCDVAPCWRLDIMQAKLLPKMQNGTSHGGVLADMLTIFAGQAAWSADELDRIPPGGNFGRDAAFRLKDQLGLTWRPPGHTRGGDDLENIRARRNALAHGLETFEEAGSQNTSDELNDVLGRVSSFMISFLRALEDYVAIKGYIAPLPPPLPQNADP